MADAAVPPQVADSYAYAAAPKAPTVKNADELYELAVEGRARAVLRELFENAAERGRLAVTVGYSAWEPAWFADVKRALERLVPAGAAHRVELVQLTPQTARAAAGWFETFSSVKSGMSSDDGVVARLVRI